MLYKKKKKIANNSIVLKLISIDIEKSRQE